MFSAYFSNFWDLQLLYNNLNIIFGAKKVSMSVLLSKERKEIGCQYARGLFLGIWPRRGP